MTHGRHRRTRRSVTQAIGVGGVLLAAAGALAWLGGAVLRAGSALAHRLDPG